ncbi:MAG: hypothetical protein R2939_20275 [Kofleriaceae bacterium]
MMRARDTVRAVAFASLVAVGACAAPLDGDEPPIEPAVGELRAAITQGDITWTFDDAYEAGQFANGDWWVVGPVTIVAIDPPAMTVAGRAINGAMINPDASCAHGYDSRLYGDYGDDLSGPRYHPELNVALGVAAGEPLHVAASSSLVSTISDLDPEGAGRVSQLRTAAVLTVLDAPPPVGAFRPPYAGTDKRIRHREAELDYGALARLPPAADAPSLAATAAGFARVWLDHCPEWISTYLHPSDNQPAYYREFTTLTGVAGLLLNSAYADADKRDLLVNVVQVGLDHAGNLEAGARWGVNGHNNGRKFPIVFAGAVLGDAELRDVGHTYADQFFGPGDPRNVAGAFSEDKQVFYVAETAPGVFNWGHGGYDAGFVGVPEWGNFHTEQPASDDARWSDGNPYRLCCSANGWIGPALTLRVMGLIEAWHQPAYFDYVDRYATREASTEWFSWDAWTGAMWRAHRGRRRPGSAEHHHDRVASAALPNAPSNSRGHGPWRTPENTEARRGALRQDKARRGALR